MEDSDKLLVGEDKNTYNISSVLYNHTGLYFCEANNTLGILSNSTPACLIGENSLILYCMHEYLDHCSMLRIIKTINSYFIKYFACDKLIAIYVESNQLIYGTIQAQRHTRTHESICS